MQKRKNAAAKADQLQDRILRRDEVARMLGRSMKTVDRLSEKGILRKVFFPKSQKAAGFRLSDVVRLIARKEQP